VKSRGSITAHSGRVALLSDADFFFGEAGMLYRRRKQRKVTLQSPWWTKMLKTFLLFAVLVYYQTIEPYIIMESSYVEIEVPLY
jgi:hypothetical protein